MNSSKIFFISCSENLYVQLYVFFVAKAFQE
jgi:hypothetical protein